jgi:zona occludens toxin
VQGYGWGKAGLNCFRYPFLYSAYAGYRLIMPINAFGGGPGTGKTYGVMEHVIIPAIAKGRFVLTNIDGLNDELIYQYVIDNFYKNKIICIGHIRRCERNAPEREDFFPGEQSLDKALPVPAPDFPVVSPGDLVVIDEATRYWPQGEKTTKADAYFFREHRHFVNEMGHTCDLVVIDPDLTLLARALKGKVEMSSLTHKPKELGINRYVVRMYRGVKLTGKPVSVSSPSPFKKEIYALYRSYAVANAKEQTIDGRQSLLKGLGSTLFFCVLLMGLGGYFLWRWMHPPGSKPAVAARPGQASAVAGSPGQPAAAPGAVAPGAKPPVSTTFRVTGSVSLRGRSWVVLSDGVHARLESVGSFVGSGATVVGDLDGERVTTWSGPRPGQQSENK